MKFNVKTKDFLKAVAFAGSVIGSKNPIPALSHVLLKAEDGTLSITGSDLDVTATARIECDVTEGGSVGLPAKLLQAFSSSLNGESIRFELVKGRMKVTCGQTKAEFPTVEAEEFPKIPEVKGSEADFTADTLASKLRQVIHAASTDASRHFLNGVLFEFKDNALNLVATSGPRLAKSSIDCKGSGEYIIPTKFASLLLSALEISDGDVSACFSENIAEFSSGQWTVQGKLIECLFPNYRQVIPNDSNPLTVERETLREVVKRANLFTDDRNSAVKLFSDGKSLEVCAGNADRSFSESIPADGAEVKIAFNPVYLLDVLAATKGDKVQLGVIDGLSPLLVKEGDFTAVVMPQRLS
jgi:DNA polymerase-3 subunit beta